MLGNLLALFKARNDPEVAKKIAAEMVVDGTIDRMNWPLVIAKSWMSLGLLGSFVLAALFLWIGAMSHWAFAIPALLFGGLIYVIIRIWRGLSQGVEKISLIAKAELTKRAQAIKIPSNKDVNP